MDRRYEHTFLHLLTKRGSYTHAKTFSGEMFKEKLLKCLTGLTNGVGIAMCSDDTH